MKKFSIGKVLMYALSLIATLMFVNGNIYDIGLPSWLSLSDGNTGMEMAVTILPATALQQVNLMTEQAWQVNQRDIDQSTIDAATFEKLLAAQASLGAPLVEKLTDSKKDHEDVAVWWPDFCGQEAEDCTDTGADLCGDLSGNATGVEKEEYNITSCINTKFKINEDTYAGSWMDFKDMLVREQNQQIIKIINKLNEKAILFLHANSGLNRGGQFVQDGSNRAEVPAGEFDDTLLVTKMLLDAEKSNVRNAFLITGDSKMWITIKNAQFDSGNAEGKGDKARTDVFNSTLDIRGFMKVPSLEGSTFLVTPYAQAFVTKNYYENSVPMYDEALGKWKYHIKVPRYGLRIDVLHQRVCVDAAKDRYEHYFNYRLHYEFLLNPKGCPVDGKQVTGILEYQNTGYDIGSS